MVLVYVLTNYEYEFIKQDCIWFRIFVTDTAHPDGQEIEKTGEVKCLGQISQAMISSSSPLRDRHIEASFFFSIVFVCWVTPSFQIYSIKSNVFIYRKQNT